MTISLRSSATGNLAAGTANSLTLAVPAGVANGDLLLAQLNHYSNSGAFTAPAGWSNLFETTEELYLRTGIWYRVASAEPADYTWTFINHYDTVGAILAFTGVDPTNPINASGEDKTNLTAPSVTTTVANCLVVTFLANGVRPRTHTPPGNVTEVVDQSAGTFASATAHAIGYFTQASAGATGAKTWTASPTTIDADLNHTVALAPIQGVTVGKRLRGGKGLLAGALLPYLSEA